MLSGRVCAVLQVMMAWSDKGDMRWEIRLISWWLFVKTRSRVFDPPEGVGLVPNVISWQSWWVSHRSISWLSIEDSGPSPFGREHKPSRQTAFGKLKSPAMIMSGTGVARLEMMLFILSMMVFLKDNLRGVPWN